MPAIIGGAHGKKRPAKAVADGVDLGIRDDGTNRFQGLKDAEPEIIIEPQIAVVQSRIVPGDHEDRVTAIDQVFDEGVAGREVQDVVLHDPGRHDQHWLCMNLVRGWRILDELNQPVAVDHLPLRDCHVLAGDKIPCALRRLPAHAALPVLPEVQRSPQEILPALANGCAEHLRVGCYEICR